MIKVVCDFCGQTINVKNIKKINQTNLDICNDCIQKLKTINANRNDVIYEIILADVCNVAEGFHKIKSKIVKSDRISSVINEFKEERKKSGTSGDWRTSIIINEYVRIGQREI